MALPTSDVPRHFPVRAGILFGLGGFFDGIVLHQVLQWHHMLSSWYPVNTIENLEFNTFWNGIFHSATYLFVVAALFVLWRAAKRKHLYWSTKLLTGSMLLGFGLFNTVEGLIDHHLLGLHHVNELVPPDRWVYWDIGFIAWGLTMIAPDGGCCARASARANRRRKASVGQAIPNQWTCLERLCSGGCAGHRAGLAACRLRVQSNARRCFAPCALPNGEALAA